MRVQTSTARSRRRLIKVLAGTGSVVLGAKFLPEKWAKPVVDSVVLPAHAQLSVPFTMSCTATPPAGTTLANPIVIDPLIYQATPNPGALPGTLDFLCDGALSSSIDIFALDATGQLSLFVSGTPCPSGTTLTIRFTVNGVSAECTWPIAPQANDAPAPQGNAPLDIRVIR